MTARACQGGRGRWRSHSRGGTAILLEKSWEHPEGASSCTSPKCTNSVGAAFGPGGPRGPLVGTAGLWPAWESRSGWKSPEFGEFGELRCGRACAPRGARAGGSPRAPRAGRAAVEEGLPAWACLGIAWANLARGASLSLEGGVPPCAPGVLLWFHKLLLWFRDGTATRGVFYMVLQRYPRFYSTLTRTESGRGGGPPQWRRACAPRTRGDSFTFAAAARAFVTYSC